MIYWPHVLLMFILMLLAWRIKVESATTRREDEDRRAARYEEHLRLVRIGQREAKLTIERKRGDSALQSALIGGLSFCRSASAGPAVPCRSWYCHRHGVSARRASGASRGLPPVLVSKKVSKKWQKVINDAHREQDVSGEWVNWTSLAQAPFPIGSEVKLKGSKHMWIVFDHHGGTWSLGEDVNRVVVIRDRTGEEIRHPSDTTVMEVTTWKNLRNP